MLDQIEETLDELEDIIIKDPQVETKSKIHDLRLALLTMQSHPPGQRPFSSVIS